MRFINIKDSSQNVSFKQAVLKPLGKQQGLYLPEHFPALPDDYYAQSLSDGDAFLRVAFDVLHPFVCDSISESELEAIVFKAFNFPLKLHSLSDTRHLLELFHGPTLAFKDFGARFLAECLSLFAHEPLTIVTATSGDTGAAVAHAFHAQTFQNMEHINVVILYPKGKISFEQEQLFCTLGNNIHTLAIEADFDTCQSLVKQSFTDPELNQKLNLNSANSINIARLLAQVCYYAALPFLLNDRLLNEQMLDEKPLHKKIDCVSVPCGNFGNITAGVIAKKIGVPIDHFIAATNANDTVPRFFNAGEWQPQPTVKTLSNAMDVSSPNNFPRLMALYKTDPEQMYREITALSIDEEEVRQLMSRTYQTGYTIDPHTAVALQALDRCPSKGQSVALSTAHPAKFSHSVESITGQAIDLPEAILKPLSQTNLSLTMEPDFKHFKEYLLKL